MIRPIDRLTAASAALTGLLSEFIGGGYPSNVVELAVALGDELLEKLGMDTETKVYPLHGENCELVDCWCREAP